MDASGDQSDEQQAAEKPIGIEIPPQANIETIRSSYNNGILEIVFKKKDDKGSRGKEIKIE